LVAALAALIVTLATVNLKDYPRTWYDEGWWLQIPRNVATDGVYATRSSEGYRFGDTVISASPAFFLPAAASLRIFGVGLVQARLVIVAWFLVVCGLTWFLARRAFGAAAGLLASFLLVVAKPDDELTSALVLGRHFMAEIPTLAFLLLGFLGVQRLDVAAKPVRRAVLIGTAFGLAMAIKSQFAMPIWTTIVLVGLIDRFWARQLRMRLFAVMLLSSIGVVFAHAVWIFLTLSEAQLATFLADYTSTGEAVAGALWSAQARWTAVSFFVRSEYSWFVIVATIYTWRRLAQQERLDLGTTMRCTFVTVWLGWFLVASVGWARYAFPALAIGHVLIAPFLLDVTGVGSRSREAEERRWRFARVVAVGLMVITLVGSGRQVFAGIATGSNDHAIRMSAFLDANVGGADRVETWEWEIVYLSQTTSFHVPPTRLLPPLMAQKQMTREVQQVTYCIDCIEGTGTKYLLTGAFANWTGFYAAYVSDRRAVVRHREGPYTLYELGQTSGSADNLGSE
jgi:4-amino-4-deoxy-L-arabinose transferase-like glycosyltransferase